MTSISKECFVIGPIGDDGSQTRIHADWLFQMIIVPVFETSLTDFKVTRADKIASPGMIDAQIISKLLDADLVIADMTHLNANAFYELGIRHMAQKPTIHMFLGGTEVPFDVKLYRGIKFNLQHPDDLIKAKSELMAAVHATLDEKYVVENPVTRTRGTMEIRAHATPEMKLIIDQIQTLSNQVADLKKKGTRAGLRKTSSEENNETLHLRIKLKPESEMILAEYQILAMLWELGLDAHAFNEGIDSLELIVKGDLKDGRGNNAGKQIALIENVDQVIVDQII